MKTNHYFFTVRFANQSEITIIGSFISDNFFCILNIDVVVLKVELCFRLWMHMITNICLFVFFCSFSSLYRARTAMFMNKKKMVRIMVSIVTLYKYLYERMAEQIKTKSFF